MARLGSGEHFTRAQKIIILRKTWSLLHRPHGWTRYMSSRPTNKTYLAMCLSSAALSAANEAGFLEGASEQMRRAIAVELGLDRTVRAHGFRHVDDFNDEAGKRKVLALIDERLFELEGV